MTQPTDPLPGLGLTALLVAGARATESTRADRLFEDPLARVFIAAAHAASPAIAETLEQRSVDNAAKRARQDSVAVRTRFYDDYLREATAAGRRQVVLLAAGLDARAFRLAWPPGTRLWELDLPEVFAFKERVLVEHDATPACVRTVVAADLREAWPATLRAAGFQPDQPAAWLVEGLLMYLDEAERNLLLARITEQSSGGSRLALDHAPGFFSTPTITTTDGTGGASAASRFASLAASAASDASLTTPGDWFASHGWRAEVEYPADLFEQHGRPVPPQLSRAPDGGARSYLATAVRA